VTKADLTPRSCLLRSHGLLGLVHARLNQGLSTAALYPAPEQGWDIRLGQSMDDKTPLLVGEEGKETKNHVPRTVTLWSLVALTYFAVAGGPEGTETMVQTAGPLHACLGIVFIGIVWSIPTALMTAELSTAFPENGGFTLWVRAAFGEFFGDMAGWLQFVSSAVDAALYPGLFVTYLKQALDLEGMSSEVAWTIQILFVAFVIALNLAGINEVGHGSLAFMFLLLAPFVAITLIAFSGVFTGTTITGWEFESKNLVETPASPDWAAFLAILLWNMGSWESTSVAAGEVANIKEVFPQALAIVFCIVVANYTLPILAFSGLDSDWAAWDNGHYVEISRAVGGPGWGVVLGCAQCFSVAGLFANGVVQNAYQICGMAEQGMLPTAIAWRLPYTQAPWVALVVTLVITCSMMPLGSFTAILGIDMSLYCAALLLEIAALIKLRYDQPDLPRAFRIPAEGFWLWMMFLPAFVVSAWAMCLGGWQVRAFALGLLGGGALIIFLVNYLRGAYPSWFSGVEGVQLFGADASKDEDA